MYHALVRRLHSYSRVIALHDAGCNLSYTYKNVLDVVTLTDGETTEVEQIVFPTFVLGIV